MITLYRNPDGSLARTADGKLMRAPTQAEFEDCCCATPCTFWGASFPVTAVVSGSAGFDGTYTFTAYRYYSLHTANYWQGGCGLAGGVGNLGLTLTCAANTLDGFPIGWYLIVAATLNALTTCNGATETPGVWIGTSTVVCHLAGSPCGTVVFTW
jgi:hypothetical protein